MRPRVTIAGGAVVLALLTFLLGASAARAADGERPLDDAAIAARVHLLGAENVDPATGAVRSDRVILSWFGVAGFVAAFNGHVVLLDAWVRRAWDYREIDTDVDELSALKPEAILVGHGHFDHALDSGYIAAKSGAPVVGTERHCAEARENAADDGQDPDKVRCILAMPFTADIGATRELDLLDGVGISVVRHPHFPIFPTEPGWMQPGLTDPTGPEPPCWPEPVVNKLPAFPQMEAMLDNVRGILEVPFREGGSLLYQFSVGDFNLTWHDTQGALDYHPAAVEAMRALPVSDVHLGSLASFNRLSNCLHDPRLYMDALRSREFVPIHHDASDPIEGRGDQYERWLLDEIRRIPAERRPCLHMIGDPGDYLRPGELTWDPEGFVPCRGERQQGSGSPAAAAPPRSRAVASAPSPTSLYACLLPG